MEHTTITLTGDGLQELQALDIQINVAATINISPKAARRRVTGWVASEVGNMLMGERPQLVVGKRTVWRVPIVLGSSTVGILGEVGAIDVDAETGEILLTETVAEDILHNAQTLSRPALQTNLSQPEKSFWQGYLEWREKWQVDDWEDEDDPFEGLRDPSPGRDVDLF